REPRCIVLGVATEGLIQQEIALVWTVSQIVDHHQFAVMRLQRSFPTSIERIVVDDQPFRYQLAENGSAFGGVFFLSGAKPGGMCQLWLSGRQIDGNQVRPSRVRERQGMDLEAS